MSRQPLGQHFLGSEAWQCRIIETLPRDPSIHWIEIGPGHGEMSRHLATRGSLLIAIETDPHLAQRLREIVAADPIQWPNVEVVSGDVLRQDFNALSSGRFRVFGNLPYYITSPILRHLFRSADRIDSIHIVIQLEVAARIVAKPGRREYGYFSVLAQFYTDPEIVLRIPPGAFKPPPKVASALVRMNLPGARRKLNLPEDDFLKFVQACFAQKRKTLRNNLRTLACDEKVREVLRRADCEPDSRAEQLSIPQFVNLFEAMRQE